MLAEVLALVEALVLAEVLALVEALVLAEVLALVEALVLADVLILPCQRLFLLLSLPSGMAPGGIAAICGTKQSYSFKNA